MDRGWLLNKMDEDIAENSKTENNIIFNRGDKFDEVKLFLEMRDGVKCAKVSNL